MRAETRALGLLLSLLSCVTLGKALHLSGPQRWDAHHKACQYPWAATWWGVGALQDLLSSESLFCPAVLTFHRSCSGLLNPE